MVSILYRASKRGHASHDWLESYHTFSFANYYDSTRVQFGALRVVNDDTVGAGMGFGSHPHDNMEIISIPTFGDLEHKDSMGNEGIIHTGDVQVMSAGTGIIHSEFNANKDKEVKFFQIWIFPDKRNVEPRYQQQSFDYLNDKNKLHQIVSPNPNDDGLWIHQNAWLNIGTFDQGATINYRLNDKDSDNGVFVMSIEGEFSISGQKLSKRDAIGAWNIGHIDIKVESENAQILIIEVPMKM